MEILVYDQYSRLALTSPGRLISASSRTIPFSAPLNASMSGSRPAGGDDGRSSESSIRSGDSSDKVSSENSDKDPNVGSGDDSDNADSYATSYHQTNSNYL